MTKKLLSKEDIALDHFQCQANNNTKNLRSKGIISHVLIQFYKWYVDSSDDKTHPVVVSISKLVYPRLEVDISKKYSNIIIHICSRKHAKSLCNHNTFLLSYHYHDILV